MSILDVLFFFFFFFFLWVFVRGDTELLVRQNEESAFSSFAVIPINFLHFSQNNILGFGNIIWLLVVAYSRVDLFMC